MTTRQFDATLRPDVTLDLMPWDRSARPKPKGVKRGQRLRKRAEAVHRGPVHPVLPRQ